MMISHLSHTIDSIVRRAITTVLVAAAFGVMPTGARAQFAIDKTEMFLNPADSTQRTGVLMVRNEGAQRAQATINIEDWDRSEDGANRFFKAGTLPQSCSQALKVFPLTLSLAPGESQAVRIDMDPVASRALSTRECWSVVLVETAVPETSANGRTLIYHLRTGLKVYAMPHGLNADGQVADIAVHSATASRDQSKDTIDVAFQNTGTKHVIARGRVEVRRPDNSVVAVVELPPAYALPGSTMRVRASLPALAIGRYVVLAVLDYGGAEIAAAQLEHEVR
jgi:P pilus assembly chaperone PapD